MRSSGRSFLADIPGVRRASVSLEAHALQEAGVIASRRGQIRILDAERLRGERLRVLRRGQATL